tara:strand:+ start:638 stop:1327 length:690 start_codon:yes stop_codon:yes gene_type:complete
MSRIRVERITDKQGTGAPLFPNGINVVGLTSLSNVVSGVVTASQLFGDGSNLTGVTATDVGTLSSLNVTGVGTFGGNVTIGGTLTYEDVTNVDSVGIVTARSGLDITAGGINVVGVITASSGVKITGNQTNNIVAMGANDVDCSAGSYFTKTITGATTFTFSNVPTGVEFSFTMEVTLNGSNAITWPTSVKWNADTAPTLTDGKTQLFMFVTSNGGTRFRGSALVDYVN